MLEKQLRFRVDALVLAASLALLGGAGLPATARAAAPKLVQRRLTRITSGTSLAAAFHRPNTAGNLILVYVVADNPGAVTVSDSAGNTYASAVGPTQAVGDPTTAQLFYAANVAAGANTVTATFATAITSRAVLYVDEYSGLDHLSPLDTTLAASGSSPTMDTGALTTTGLNELLFVGAETNLRSVRHLTRGYRKRGRRAGTLTAERIAPTAGSYQATAVQSGTAWIMQIAAFQTSSSTPPNTAYPLKVSANGRYLVDQNGVPFLLTGDSPQALMVNLSEAEADAFFADRQAAGFNAVWINLLCATYTGGRADGSTYDGIVPFNTPGDLSTPNPVYFARIDDMLNLAAAHGLMVVLDPAETGSFLGDLVANGVTKSRNYGRYLGTRYRNFDNILWMSGNDFQSWQNAGDDVVVQAVAQGIRDNDDRHLHTVELDYLVSGSLDDPGWRPLIELNASYTYYPTYAQVLTDYNRANPLPTFMVEANYEFEHNAADEGTPQILRRQEYWSLLSGAAGHLYGNRYTWPFIGGWQANLDTTGSRQIGYTTNLFAPRAWYNLVPDQNHTVVTAGNGTYVDTGALGDRDYLTAARTPDGALVIAYMPTSRTITVDMTKLGSSAYAWWYDPASGEYTPVPGSPLPNTGARNFTPPGANADGDGDWALVLDANGVPPDTEKPTAPTGLHATAVTSSEVDLAWTASQDNVGVAGYRVYRGATPLGTTSVTSYGDTGLAAATMYTYTVVAFDYFGNVSDPSAPLDVTTASPGPAFVQQGYAVPQSPQSTVSAAYPGAQSAGDTNVVAIGWNDVTASIASVHDGAGNVYQVAVPTFRGNGLSQAIYYAANIVASLANQVTVDFDQAAVFVDLRAVEYAGLKQSAPFDAGMSASGSGTSASVGNITTTAAGDLLFAAGMTSASFSGPGAGFSSRVITSPDGDIAEDREAAGAGSYGAAAPLDSGTWLLQIAGFQRAP